MMKRSTDGSDNSPVLAVSIGEPAGIGPDIIIRSWLLREQLNLPRFTVFGHPQVLVTRAQELGVSVRVQEVADANEAARTGASIPVIATKNQLQAAAGKPDANNSAGVIEAIEMAVKAVLAEEFDGLVTCPINKKNLYEAGFEFPGHTEYLAELGKDLAGADLFPVMMLAGPQLRTVPVTIHIALEQVKEQLNRELIIKTARVAAQDLANRLGIEDPVLAIAGLNPHAGEEGAMGREELDFIIPAVNALKADGINAVGPLPADTMFHERARQKYDVAICMYHDQALIPAKTLGFDDAVNVTLGLPFIRTSPDHGTAYDIAGTGLAKPDSFIAALKLAETMALREKQST